MLPYIMLACLSVFGLQLGLFALIILAGRTMTNRRTPDAPTHPGEMGLPYEDVKFLSRYKVTLHGWWIPAPNPQGTVIFAHGQDGSMEGDLAQAVPLHQAGYHVLMFNFRAHGTSEGNKITFGVFEKEDLLGAVDFVRAEKGVDKVAVMGFSMGAAVAMISAALSPHITTLILDGAFLKLVSVLKNWFRMKGLPTPLAWLCSELTVLGASIVTNTRMFQVSPLLWARHIPPETPILFIHGENDQLVGLEELQTLMKDLRGHKDIWVAPGSAHREAFRGHPETYNQRVLAWLAEYARK